MHHFRLGKTYYGFAYPEDFDGVTQTQNEKAVSLGEVFSKPQISLNYEYDFGGSWEHAIVLEEILPPEPDVTYPVCLAGEQACPPEDWGDLGFSGISRRARALYSQALRAIDCPSPMLKSEFPCAANL